MERKPFLSVTQFLTAATLCFLLFVFCGTGMAYAQSSRIYFAGYMGLNSNFESHFEEDTVPASGDFEFKNAVSFAGAIGLRLNRNIRIEGELSYRDSDFDSIDIDGTGQSKLGGSLKTWMFMLNGYYDFDLKWWNLEPFVTAGLGLAHHNADIGDPAGALQSASDDSIALGWQLGGGLKYRVSDDLAFTGGYRYVGTTDLGIGDYDLGYDAHEIRFGIEYDLPIK